MRILLTSGAVLLGLIASIASAKTVYVDGVTGDDAWDGFCETFDGGMCGPKASITAGIAVADNGDLVLIADAIYTGAKNRKIKFFGKRFTVRSANGPENCIIDAQGSEDAVFQFDEGETIDSVLDGVTVKNCYGC